MQKEAKMDINQAKQIKFNEAKYSIEEIQDAYLRIMEEEIKFDGATAVYNAAVKIQCLGDMTEARFNQFASLIEQAQEKGLLS